MRFYQRALDIHTKYKDRPSEANTRSALARMAQKLGDKKAMYKHCFDALAIFDTLQILDKQVNCYCFLSTEESKDKNWAQAEGYCHKALEIAVKENDTDLAGRAFFSLALVFRAQQREEDAVREFENAFKNLKPGRNRAISALQLGLNAANAGHYSRAKEYLMESLNSADGDLQPTEKAAIYLSLGTSFLKDPPIDLIGAERSYWQALSLYIETDNRERRRGVERLLKEVISLVSPTCKQACETYHAAVTDNAKVRAILDRIVEIGALASTVN